MKVLLIDDHSLFRKGVQNLLKGKACQVKTAASGGEGIDLLTAQEFDVVLLDLRMEDCDGFEVLRWAKSNNVKEPIIVLTSSEDTNDLYTALDLGANGYLLKDTDPDLLIEALRKVIDNELVVAPALAEVMSEYEKHRATIDRSENSELSEIVTKREMEVLQLIAKGQSNRTIAECLDIAQGTVKIHVKSILSKLHIKSRVEAAVIAIKSGSK